MLPYNTDSYRTTDYGFFGPDSMAWKLWTAPTALIAFQRSVVLEHFDAPLAAAVADMGGIYDDPARRLDATLAYFVTVATADSKTAIAASEHLMTVHAKATGIEPISGRRYAANNPASQLWIHVTGWHSVLKCYEEYGPGPLTAEEEQRYWAESVIAAQLQTCDPAQVPTSRAEVHDYFDRVRPGLCTSERAYRGMHYLLRTGGATSNLRFRLGSRLIAPATVATLPGWMRRVGGFDQPALVDLAVRPLTRAAMAAAANPAVAQSIIRQIAPMTAAVLAAHRATTSRPETAAVVSPAQARERYGTRGRTGVAG